MRSAVGSVASGCRVARDPLTGRGGFQDGPRATLHRVERAPNATRAILEDVRVDHGRGHVAVAEDLLHRADAVAALQQVGGEGVAEGVAGHPLVETSLARCILHCPLQDALMEVMASLQAARIFPARARRKDPLPAPRSRRGGNLPLVSSTPTRSGADVLLGEEIFGGG